MRALVLLFVLTGCAKHISPPKDSDIKVKAFDFAQEWNANEAKAEMKYGDKWIVTLGIPGQVSRDGDYFLMPLGGNGTEPIVCRFDSSQKESLSQLKEKVDYRAPGEKYPDYQIAVIGRISKQRFGAKYPHILIIGRQVNLDNCEFRPMPSEWMPKNVLIEPNRDQPEGKRADMKK